MKKRWLFVAIVVTVAVAVPATVWAVSGSNTSVVDHHSMAWRTSSKTTTGASFSNVTDLDVDVFSVFGMSADLSVTVTGSPVVFRVTDTSIGGTQNMLPGPVTFTPTTGNSNFTYHFVDEGAAAPHDHMIQVQWKLVTAGGSATVKMGDLDVFFQDASAS